MRNGIEGVKDYIDAQDLSTSIHKYITCKGTVSFNDLPSVLSDSDILLHVKVGDWCPNAVLEAMGCGLPVVSPSFGGTKELVGEAGICINGPEWDINDDLVDGMVQAITEVQSNLLEYKYKARERILREFDITNISKLYLAKLGYLSE